MARYMNWQNTVTAAQDMCRARYIEIPALHQSCVYWRRDILNLGGYELNPAFPVDMDFWMRWLGSGRTATKIAEPLYAWRQHHGQGTRSSGRCAVDNLRRCKAHFLSEPSGPCYGRHVQVWSSGATLVQFAEALVTTASTGGNIKSVSQVEWDTKQHQGKTGAPPAPLHEAASGERFVRLFVYGMARARRRVQAMVRNFDPEHDWFAA